MKQRNPYRDTVRRPPLVPPRRAARPLAAGEPVSSGGSVDVACTVSATSQMRHCSADPAAVAAAKAGEPLPDKLVQYNAMARDAGWDNDTGVPPAVRG